MNFVWYLCAFTLQQQQTTSTTMAMAMATNACTKLVTTTSNSHSWFGNKTFLCVTQTPNVHTTHDRTGWLVSGKGHCNSVAIKTKVRIRLNIRCRTHTQTSTNNGSYSARVIFVLVCASVVNTRQQRLTVTSSQLHKHETSERPLCLDVCAILLIQRPKSHCASWAFFVYFSLASETTNMCMCCTCTKWLGLAWLGMAWREWCEPYLRTVKRRPTEEKENVEYVSGSPPQRVTTIFAVRLYDHDIIVFIVRCLLAAVQLLCARRI